MGGVGSVPTEAMLSAVRQGALKACFSSAPARPSATRPVSLRLKSSGPHFVSSNQFRFSQLQRRFCSTNSYEEGESDREELAFSYFHKKMSIDDVRPPIKSRKQSAPSSGKPSVAKKAPSPQPEQQEKALFEKKEIQVTSEDAGSRMDRFVTRLYPRLPNARIQKLLRDKKVCFINPNS